MRVYSVCDGDDGDGDDGGDVKDGNQSGGDGVCVLVTMRAVMSAYHTNQHA